MIFGFKRQSKANLALRKVELLLKCAHPVLVDTLTADISTLDRLLELPPQQNDEANLQEQNAQLERYGKAALGQVLLAAANYHLKLKLGKARVAPKDLPLLKYLNPSDPNVLSFASTCKRIYKDLESCDETMARVHWTELRNVYAYLLSRIA